MKNSMIKYKLVKSTKSTTSSDDKLKEIRQILEKGLKITIRIGNHSTVIRG